MGGKESKFGTQFCKLRSNLKFDPKDESIVSNDMVTNHMYPCYGQSKEKVNNAKFIVKLECKQNVGVSIGVSSMCLRKDAKTHKDYAREFYMIDCMNGIFICNSYHLYLASWPKKFAKGDKISLEMSGDKLSFHHNDHHLGTISSQSFGFEEFYLTVSLWPQNTVHIVKYNFAEQQTKSDMGDILTKLPPNEY